LKVALDFDNVLADTTGEWIKYYNMTYDKCISKTDLNDYYYWNSLNISREQAFKIFYIVWNRWKSLPLLEDNAGEIIRNLREKCEIDIS
jgi:5'(3')-deoxyribonucleotidase